MRSLGWAPLVLSLGLSGCGNMVLSREPLFARDRAAEHSLKHGVWANPESGCEFDAERRVQDWPDCANGLIISRRSFDERSVLAAGEPMILQGRAGEGEGRRYWYAALQPLGRDSSGRISSYVVWMVQCGPPPAEGDRKVTETPGPGLIIDGDNCLADDAETVRAAAVPSQYWTKQEAGMVRWIRKRRPTDHDPDAQEEEVFLVPKPNEAAPVPPPR